MRVRVKVPATTANLGPGFDVLGMALELYNYLEVEKAPAGLEIAIEGEGAGTLPRDSSNLVVRAMDTVFERVGKRPRGMRIWLKNHIPLARGLGSSAAAVVAGLVGANLLLGEPLDKGDLLDMAVSIEGHPDNVTPALFGGLVVCLPDSKSLRYVRIPVPAAVRVLVAVPDMTLPTREARGVLPAQVSMADAVFNVGRAACLVGAILTRNRSMLGVAMQDRLHQPYRRALVPGMADAMEGALRAGALGVALSGAGPSLLAFVQEGDEAHGVVRAMEAAFRDNDVNARVFHVAPDLFGARGSTREALWPYRLVVHKYGGTSVADAGRIRAVARRVARERDQGNDVVVVVSAMGDSTDRLLDLAAQVSSGRTEREMDMLLSTGEQVSIALLSMAIQDLGHAAVSLTGAQVGIYTDPRYTRAKILGVDRQHVMAHLDEGKVVVVAGFQGVSESGDITTLGRGGSDTTAVALAGALGASLCEIYTDVDGVYTADPNLVPSARKIEELSYDEMSEMATLGARVLQPRAVEFARKYGMTLHVRSSFVEDQGTMVRGMEQMMEKVLIRAVTHSTDEVKVVVEGVPDRPGVAAKLFSALADKSVRVDMILQSMRRDGRNDIAFTVAREDSGTALAAAEGVALELGAWGAHSEDNIAKVSVVGAGISRDVQVAADMFDALAKEGINIDMISTSGIRISCIIPRNRVHDAVRALHARFRLDEE
ncbi:MAG: aspartate kinase [Bacillota bacterium]|jgi:aspartate kinase